MLTAKETKNGRFLGILLALVITLAFVLSVTGAAEAADTAGIKVYVTISDKGELARDKSGRIMAHKAVTVKDLDGDGKYSVNEALTAAHAAYYAEGTDGYAAAGDSVSKLWGVSTYSLLFFVNDKGLSHGVGTDTVSANDDVAAAIMSDTSTYTDYYTFFNAKTRTVTKGQKMTLNLKGHLGMAMDEKDKADTAMAGFTVSTADGRQLGTTDAKGSVTFSFDKEGTYIITAAGKARATVDLEPSYALMKSARDADDRPIYGKMDWSTYAAYIAYTKVDYGDGPYPMDDIKYVDFSDFDAETWTSEDGYLLYSGIVTTDAPTIPPVCIVTVTKPALAKASVKAAGTGWSTVKVSWSKVKGASKYQVYRAAKKNGSYKKVGTTTKRSWTDNNRTPGRIYYYKVRATASGSTASTSKIASAKAQAKAPVLTLKAGKNRIYVQWTRVKGANGYKLYRAVKRGGRYSLLHTAKGEGNLRYTSLNKKTGKKYYYKVRAYKTVKGRTVNGRLSSVKVMAAR